VLTHIQKYCQFTFSGSDHGGQCLVQVGCCFSHPEYISQSVRSELTSRIGCGDQHIKLRIMMDFGVTIAVGDATIRQLVIEREGFGTRPV
jgi:hypothetical protein